VIAAAQLIARAIELEATARLAELAGCTRQASEHRATAAELRCLARHAASASRRTGV
jgi:hypothetical protein